MRSVSFIAGCAFIASTCFAFARDPVGHYKVSGSNPGGNGSYSGEVTVKKTGDTFEVSWTVGDTKYVGTGVGNDEFITVGYKSGDSTGVALYSHEGDNWKGIWTYAGGTTLGLENWTRD